MDAVPDSVFICAKSGEHTKQNNPNGAIYANRKMNTFFGCNVTSNTDKKKTWLKRAMIDGVYPNAQIETDPLKKRIFSRKNASIHEGRVANQNLSFLDILTLNREDVKDVGEGEKVISAAV